MTYTTCEICKTEQYCLLQFCKDAPQDDTIIVKKAVCLECLTHVYKQLSAANKNVASDISKCARH